VRANDRGVAMNPNHPGKPLAYLMKKAARGQHRRKKPSERPLPINPSGPPSK
jgi:hypothetical protein